MPENDLPEQLRIRREKRESLLGRGIAPYPVSVNRTASLKEIRERFKDLATDSPSGVIESVAGRIIFIYLKESVTNLSILLTKKYYNIGKMKLTLQN